MKHFKSISFLIVIIIINCAQSQSISSKKAFEDLVEFKILLETQSSYYQVSTFDFEKRYKVIEKEIQDKDSVPIHYLAFEFEKIIAETIDRHANIRMKDFDENSNKMFNLHFPFALAHLDGKAVALMFDKSERIYKYYSAEYPYLKSINGIAINEFIDKYAYRRKLSPVQAKLNDGLQDIRDIGELYFKQGKSKIDVSFILTDGTISKKIILPLSNIKNFWFDMSSLWIKREYRDFFKGEDFDLNKLDKWMTDSIAYLAIPSMVSYDENPKFESYLKSTIEKYRNSKALIIDIRGNGGGTREILNTLSGYFVQPEQSPWVANVAYVRSDQFLDEDIASMKGRFLYNYNSEALSEKDREAIDKFKKVYQTQYKVDENKFSTPYYMVMNSNHTSIKCPIYIMTNEETFSAASVFASVFKGLPNVKIIGVNTNGSSGRSKKFNLKHSNIRVKLSTMLSFQRNGKTLDGNGTSPDIIIEIDENQMLGRNDNQLEKLIKLIKS